MQAWHCPGRSTASAARSLRAPTATRISASMRSNFTLEDASGSPPSTDGRTVLYTHCLCPYAERAWLVLLEKASPAASAFPAACSPSLSLPTLQGVPFHLCHIDLSSKPAWYRSVNPRGLVPAVAHNGNVQVESLDILRWADATLPGPALTPSDKDGQDRMKKLISAGSAFSEAGLAIMAGRTGRYWGIGSGASASQKKDFEAALKKAIVDPIKESGGPYLMGSEVSLADLAVYPFVARFAVGAPEFAGYGVRTALGGVAGEWLRAMRERASGAVTTADDAALLKAYQTHRSLDFFDYDTYLATALHPQNEIYREN